MIFVPNVCDSFLQIFAAVSVRVHQKVGAFTKNGQSPPSQSTPHMTDRPLTDFIETEPQTPS